MNIEKIIKNLTSKESQPIREAGAEIIRNSQNVEVIEKLIPFLNTIKKGTHGLELGGAFASNNRFYKFPIEIIAFHKNRKSFWNKNKECTCKLYLSKTFESFNPDVEKQNDTIKQNIKIKGNWTHDHEIECLKCSTKFYVSERHYHYIWWKWIEITEIASIEESGNSVIDKEAKFILSSILTVLKNEPRNHNELVFNKQRLQNFRTKLASSRETEFYEGQYNWGVIFNDLENHLPDNENE